MNVFETDTLTLIASVTLLLLGILTPMLSPFFRFRKAKHPSADDAPDTAGLPPLSIILTPLDDAFELKKNLPALLRQDYAPGYQVIIVIGQGDHEAESIIGEVLDTVDLAQTHAEVYVTCIPQSSRYISRKKLAITLGIKAARHEWVLPTEASCRPASPQWLAGMARHCTPTTNLVIGYGRYEESTLSFRRYERLRDSHYLMREDAVGTAYRTNSHNLLLRKQTFMEGDGYLGNLHLMRGEYDFLVNKYAARGTTALEIGEGAWLVEDEPTDKTWLNKHIFYMESRKFLARGARHRWLFNLDQAALHLSLLLAVAGVAYGALTRCWVLLGCAAVTLVVNIVLRTILCHKALSAFDEAISPIKAFFFELTIVWRNLGYWLRYRRADRNDFTTHKL